MTLKDQVKEHWETETCGTRFSDSEDRQVYFDEIEASRYKVIPFLHDFAAFDTAKGLDVLEIGVGAGTDFLQWLRNGARPTGIDLTEAAIQLTRERMELNGFDSSSFSLRVGDGEELPFDDASFDQVYSYGVLHHSPNTVEAIRQTYRVLKPGGRLKLMVYKTRSWTGLMLWVRYGLLSGHPFRSEKDVVFHHLESPGTKIYSLDEFSRILSDIGFDNVMCRAELGNGDLLDMPQSERFGHPIYKLIWLIYPRWLVRLLGPRFGSVLLATAVKPAAP